MYDTIIIGAGPAGLSAGIYAARAGMSVLLLSSGGAGGQAANAHLIENYPGFENGISGGELCAAMEAQALRLGVEMKKRAAKKVMMEGAVKTVSTSKDTYEAKTVIIATGAAPRKLGLEREKELTGSGVSYCATCDGGFYKDKVVAVVGGGDTAVMDGVFLSRIAKKVYLIHRRDALRAAKASENALKACPNVEILWDSAVQSLQGAPLLSGIEVKNLKTGQTQQLAVEGLFVAVGSDPQTGLFEGMLELNKGYIPAPGTKTAIDGVFAAGDVRADVLRQVVTAAADGAIAATLASEYIAL
jgi:thioredoxin reductase (NADPH)